MTIPVRTMVVLCLLASFVGFESARAACPDCGLSGALTGRDSCYTCGCADWRLPWAKSSYLPAGGSPKSLPPWPVGECDAGGCESTFWIWSGGCCDPWIRRWTVTADALLLQRSAGQSGQGVLFAPAGALPGVVALTMDDLGGRHQVGPRVSLTRHITPDYGLEVGYFGLDGGSASAVRDGNPNILFPGDGVPIISSQLAVDYESTLHSVEMNLRHQYFSRLNLLAGLRWMEVRESFHVGGPNIFVVDAPPVSYDRDATNSLYGFQIGADAVLLDRGTRWQVDGFLKSGVFANSSREQTSTVNAIAQSVVGPIERNDQTAFVGEIGLTGIYHISDHVDARAGYQVMWIEGVALAPDQFLDPADGVLYHGFHLGFEAWW